MIEVKYEPKYLNFDMTTRERLENLSGNLLDAEGSLDAILMLLEKSELKKLVEDWAGLWVSSCGGDDIVIEDIKWKWVKDYEDDYDTIHPSREWLENMDPD